MKIVTSAYLCENDPIMMKSGYTDDSGKKYSNYYINDGG